MAERTALVRFLRARGAADEAEDILQELWLKLDQFVPEGPIGDPRSYIFRMADNLMHARVRAAMRRAKREQSWSDDTYPSRSDERVNPERDAAARQRLKDVAMALATLGERTQTIFHRFRVEGVGQALIAEEEGISRSAVEKHLQRAYRLLATLADEDRASAQGRNT